MKLLEFIDHESFLAAARIIQDSGMLVEVYSFLPEDNLVEELKLRSRFLPIAAVAGALVGAGGGFLLQYIPNIFSYPMNIGGRPLNSWPAFLIITFELSVLTSAFFIFFGFILCNKLPRFDRVVYAVDAYNRHRHDRYFILVKQEVAHVGAFAIHDLDPLL